jgi:hypothetical protein
MVAAILFPSTCLAVAASRRQVGYALHHQNSKVVDWAANEKRIFEEELRAVQEWEERDNRNLFERFK